MATAVATFSAADILGKGPDAPRLEAEYLLDKELGKGAFGVVHLVRARLVPLPYSMAPRCGIRAAHERHRACASALPDAAVQATLSAAAGPRGTLCLCRTGLHVAAACATDTCIRLARDTRRWLAKPSDGRHRPSGPISSPWLVCIRLHLIPNAIDFPSGPQQHDGGAGGGEKHLKGQVSAGHCASGIGPLRACNTYSCVRAVRSAAHCQAA
jgi:hypothetical protein